MHKIPTGCSRSVHSALRAGHNPSRPSLHSQIKWKPCSEWAVIASTTCSSLCWSPQQVLSPGAAAEDTFSPTVSGGFYFRNDKDSQVLSPGPSMGSRS